jgi:hypothetical protein
VTENRDRFDVEAELFGKVLGLLRHLIRQRSADLPKAQQHQIALAPYALPKRSQTVQSILLMECTHRGCGIVFIQCNGDVQLGRALSDCQDVDLILAQSAELSPNGGGQDLDHALGSWDAGGSGEDWSLREEPLRSRG